MTNKEDYQHADILKDASNDCNNEQSDKDCNRSTLEKAKSKQRKKRELEDLADSQIINARLRSDSGKVYSSGLVVDPPNQDQPALETVTEEETLAQIDIQAEMCLKGDCCKNTSKIIQMISKLQSSVDSVLNKNQAQESIAAENAQKIEGLEEKVEKNEEDVEELIGELKDTKFQLELVTNTVIRQDQQIEFLKKKITEIQQREMLPNIIISGIPESKNEKTIMTFNSFVANQLEIQELIPANKAFRLGSGINRPLLVELRNPEQKKKLYASATKLRGKTNPSGSFYFISDHLPEEMNEDRRRANELISENKKKASSHKLDMNITRGKLVINEEVYQKSVKAPSARDILRPSDDMIKIARSIEIIKGDEDIQQKSQFGSFAATVKSFEEVRAAYLKLKMKYSDATHVSCAFRLPGVNTPQNQDYIDNGEFGCGRSMLKTLKQEKAMNIAVFLVRYYGGKHLGTRRYEIFKELTEKAIHEIHASKAKGREPEENAPDTLPTSDTE